MEVREAIEKRKSVRKFTSKSVDIELIEELLYYANKAPSAGNLQARDFIIVTDEEQKEKLAIASYNQNFIKEAPIVVVFCANLNRISPYGERKEILLFAGCGSIYPKFFACCCGCRIINMLGWCF